MAYLGLLRAPPVMNEPAIAWLTRIRPLFRVFVIERLRCGLFSDYFNLEA